jgi:hypothetical protein
VEAARLRVETRLESKSPGRWPGLSVRAGSN